MEHATVVEILLQLLPFGAWFNTSAYGIVYGAVLLNFFSCLILMVSKAIFKVYFASPVRTGFALICIGGTMLLAAAGFLYVTITMIPYAYIYHASAPNYSQLLPMYRWLSFIAYAFFIGYLIDFVIRLGFWLKRGRGEKITSS